MSEHNEAEVQLYNHTDRLLGGHRTLLRDGNRNRSFYRALSDSITNESVVLDIGSGTGIWAVVAAMLGARRVVAIEYEPLLIGVIKALAAENGVADKVEVVVGDSRDVQLGKEFDLVISETIGHMVFDESIVSIMIDARERFLKPGGLLIPQEVRLVAAAAHLDSFDETLPAGIRMTASAFETLAMNIPIALRDRSLLKVLTAPQTLMSVDLQTASETPELTDLTARWRLTETGENNCFAVWAEAVLTGDISITTSQTTSWLPMIYGIKPFQRRSGDVKFSLTLTSESNYWTVTIADGEYLEEQSYSPALAAAELSRRSPAYPHAPGQFEAAGA